MVQTATKKNALSSKDGLPLANIGSIIKIQFRFNVLLTLDAVIFKIEIIIDSAYNNNRGCEAYQNRFNVCERFTADQYAVYKWLGCKCLPLADGAGYKLFGA